MHHKARINRALFFFAITMFTNQAYLSVVHPGVSGSRAQGADQSRMSTFYAGCTICQGVSLLTDLIRLYKLTTN